MHLTSRSFFVPKTLAKTLPINVWVLYLQAEGLNQVHPSKAYHIRCCHMGEGADMNQPLSPLSGSNQWYIHPHKLGDTPYENHSTANRHLPRYSDNLTN